MLFDLKKDYLKKSVHRRRGDKFCSDYSNEIEFFTSAQVIGFGTSLGVVMVRVIMSREIPAENQGEGTFYI